MNKTEILYRLEKSNTIKRIHDGLKRALVGHLETQYYGSPIFHAVIDTFMAYFLHFACKEIIEEVIKALQEGEEL